MLRSRRVFGSRRVPALSSARAVRPFARLVDWRLLVALVVTGALYGLVSAGGLAAAAQPAAPAPTAASPWPEASGLNPAAASLDQFVFTGRGYGHGVGMSQWGAWEAAREGKDYRFILDFYYTGVSIDPLSPADPILKVKLSSEPWKDVSTITQEFGGVDLVPTMTPATLVYPVTGGEQQVEVPAAASVQLTRVTDGVRIVVAGSPDVTAAWAELRPASGGRLRVTFQVGSSNIAPREYWGTQRVEPSTKAGLLVDYNLVPLELYLRSIAEIDPDWARSDLSGSYAPEAVKAQAVAARTYAVANMVPYLNDNQWDQVYRGYTFEQTNPGIGQAAEDTAGLVMRYQGNVIPSFFSSSSGGYTSSWNGDPAAPYLPVKADPYSLRAPVGNPGYGWTFTISGADLSQAVDGMTDVAHKTVHVGTVTKVEVVDRETSDPQSHAKTIRLTGSEGSALVSATAFRGCFGYGSMRSTLILAVRNPGFSDLTPAGMYYAEIMRVVDLGLLSGYPDGTFGPLNPVSRWQFAKIAVNLHNAVFPAAPIPLVDVSSPPFRDVAARPGTLGDESDWVAAARAAGLVEGTDATHFAPYLPVRRDQMASMIVRAMGWEDEVAALPPGTEGFGDMPPSNQHTPAATYLKTLGVLQGYVDASGSPTLMLRPAEATKRQHVAVILTRILDLPQR